MRSSWAGFFVLAVVVGIFASQGEAADEREGGKGRPGTTVSVYIAASTKDVIQELAESFKKETKVEVKIKAGASNKLADEIIAGATADLFLSADREYGKLVQDKELSLEATDLLSNKLVIVVPKGNPAGVKVPDDLLNSDAVKKVALAGEKVPAGIYAKQALETFKIYDKLVDGGKVVRGDDVRATLALVEQSKAEAGIVYLTDGKESDKVEIAYTFKAKTHEKIVYPLLRLKNGGNIQGGQQFYRYLTSDDATKVFEKYGFIHIGKMRRRN